MKKYSTAFLIVFLIVGLALLIYPSFSDFLNSKHQTKAVVDYENSVSNLTKEDYSQMWQAAQEYNNSIAENGFYGALSDSRQANYDAVLDVNGYGMMGYIEIPSIRVNLPIYHNTDDSTLEYAVGHCNWSSLPIGGAGCHAILSGHRGLPSAKLFTNLDRLKEGEIFKLYILDEVLTYKVDKISVVEPEEVNEINVIPGGDFCTLLTCTPYGINTHRLLVRGQRIATTETLKAASEARQIDPLVVATLLFIPMFLIAVAATLIQDARR